MAKAQKTDDKAQALALREAGRSYKEIAEELSIPIGSVRGWCHRAGLKVKSPLELLLDENQQLRARVESLESQLAAITYRQGEQKPTKPSSDLYEMEVISLENARAKRLKKYFTGEPCSRGHIAPRTVCNRACVACAEERNKKPKG